jgi:hypothetical protein
MNFRRISVPVFAAAQQWLEKTLGETDGIKKVVASLVDWHSDAENAKLGACLLDAAEELKTEVANLLETGEFGENIKDKFPSLSEKEEKKETGSEVNVENEAAQKGADAVFKAAMTIKSWPKPFQDHFEKMLKKDDGWKQMCKDLVRHTLCHHRRCRSRRHRRVP